MIRSGPQGDPWVRKRQTGNPHRHQVGLGKVTAHLGGENELLRSALLRFMHHAVAGNPLERRDIGKGPISNFTENRVQVRSTPVY